MFTVAEWVLLPRGAEPENLLPRPPPLHRLSRQVSLRYKSILMDGPKILLVHCIIEYSTEEHTTCW